MEADPVKRSTYLEKIRSFKPETLVYIDESGIDLALQKEKGWGKKDEILLGRKSGQYYKRINIVETSE